MVFMSGVFQGTVISFNSASHDGYMVVYFRREDGSIGRLYTGGGVKIVCPD